MLEILFWFYLVNIALFIQHKMVSTCWKEWELFHLPLAVQLSHAPDN